ncbi:right-handed parallel beta-helix repeat-containing protein [Anthocerotibacter panamensis]|uniref:right-handed parallel beta-helix repeat-containing protein n=1 Tax=Anthocerotibacter panamensis TaxID=2857077 RepID=UPI001C402D26|nr:right-handed parallel beta-helix repeat-containing protein [Anthocerotibacter panamensis]
MLNKKSIRKAQSGSTPQFQLRFNKSLRFLQNAWLLMALAGVGLVAPVQAAPLFNSDCPPGQIVNQGGCQSLALALAANGGRVYYVAQNDPNARDSNPGTQGLPWKTISRASSVLNPGDAVIVRRGVYREQITPRVGGTDAAHRVTYAAYTGEQVVVEGADVVTDWTKSGNTWRTPWTLSLPVDAGLIRQAYATVQRREMVIVDGKVLRPVSSQGAVVPGTFYVQGSMSAPTAIYMRTFNDSAPSGHIVELAKRTPLFNPKSGTGWYRVINFTFRHAPNAIQRGAVVSGATGGLFEENVVEWNNAVGIHTDGGNHVFRGNSADDNGQMGWGGVCDNCLLDYNEAMRNNWKGYQVGWESGGGKFSRSQNLTIRNHLAGDNQGPGIWLDVYDDHDVIEQSEVYRNYMAGIMLEYYTHDILVRNNVVWGNRFYEYTGAGILTQAAYGNTIVNNTIVGNQAKGVWFRRDPRLATVGSNKVVNNIFAANGTLANGGGQGGYEVSVEATDIANFRSNLFNGNIYYHAGAGSGTKYFSANIASPPAGVQRNTVTDDFATWRQLINGDGSSFVTNPLLQNLSSYTGWHLLANSPARCKGVSPPVAVKVDIEGQPRPATKADIGADQALGVCR